MPYDFDNATVATRDKRDAVREMVAALSNLDALARAMERKWGAARLPALVSDELCQKFYRQRQKLAVAPHDQAANSSDARRHAIEGKQAA